jgi:predicted nucleic acid-binding protein
LDSVLIILEAKGKAPSDLETFLTSLASFKGLSFYFLTLLDRLESTRIMRDHKLDFEDSTLVRTARRLKAEGIVSFDQDFNRVNDIKRVEPSEIRKSLR